MNTASFSHRTGQEMDAHLESLVALSEPKLLDPLLCPLEGGGEDEEGGGGQ
jgi:hypothetical protein